MLNSNALPILIISAALFSLSIRAAEFKEPNPTGTIHLYAAVDELDPDVGLGCKVSFGRLFELLKSVRPGFDRLKIYRFKDGRVPSAANALLFYNWPKNVARPDGIPEAKPNDVDWFFYCGHGFRDARGRHVLQMDGSLLPVDDLRRAMEGRKTQGVLITTDACATKGEYEPQAELAFGKAPADRPWELISQLIGDLHGTVVINAASPGKPAFVDIQDKKKPNDVMGALFTNALYDLLNEEISVLDLDKNKVVDWSEAFVFLREQTRENFRVMRYRFPPARWNQFARGVNDQIPYAFSLGKLPRAESTTPAKPVVVSHLLKIQILAAAGDRFVFTADFDKSLVGHDIYAGIFFRDDKGNAITSTKREFSDGKGGLATTKTIRITEENRNADVNHPLEFYAPSDAVANGQFPAYYIVYLHDLSTKTNLYQTSRSMRD